jgi:7-carboxy-7-deazaguanine synthase
MRVSEIFFSIQGEGFSSGVPSVFVRVAHCNLMCGGEHARLVKDGLATWWCDSEDVWRKSTEMTNEQILDRIRTFGQGERLFSGETHLIITGGEPTIPSNRHAIMEFIFFLRGQGNPLYLELETNGALHVPEFFRLFTQVNCSPKLANSGMPRGHRINPQALEFLATHPGGWFKFVVSGEGDVEEIERDFIEPFHLPRGRVVLMPGVDRREDLPAKTLMAWELAKKYGYRMCTRLHILAYDQVTGV